MAARHLPIRTSGAQWSDSNGVPVSDSSVPMTAKRSPCSSR